MDLTSAAQKIGDAFGNLINTSMMLPGRLLFEPRQERAERRARQARTAVITVAALAVVALAVFLVMRINKQN